MHWLLRFFFTRGEILRDLIFLGCLVFACLVPRFADRTFSSIEDFGSRLAERKLMAILVIAIATIVIRLSVLWLLPVPYPQVHDEFSYLLAADTFASRPADQSPAPDVAFLRHLSRQPAPHVHVEVPARAGDGARRRAASRQSLDRSAAQRRRNVRRRAVDVAGMAATEVGPGGRQSSSCSRSRFSATG